SGRRGSIPTFPNCKLHFVAPKAIAGGPGSVLIASLASSFPSKPAKLRNSSAQSREGIPLRLFLSEAYHACATRFGEPARLHCLICGKPKMVCKFIHRLAEK